MDIYVIDDLLRRVAVFDRYESFIWTERWREIGDFKLVMHSTPAARSRLTEGTRLVIHESDYVMEIEDIEDARSDDGKKMLSITGRTLEKTLEERVATEGMQGLTTDSDWVINGTPGSIARYIFNKICIEGILSPSDVIPFITAGAMYPPGTIPESNYTYSASIPINTVYGTIKELCDTYDMGFRITRKLETSQLYFEIYSGNDRTSRQSDFTPVIFSPDLDNMKNTKELKSVKDYKNVAYVFSKNGSAIVYGDNAGTDTAGFERRVIFVDAKDVEDAAGPGLTSILQNKGLDALAQHKRVLAFDGEVSQYSPYKYGRDYGLGDLVEMRNSDGATNNMRVTEQIFVSDAEGVRSYPTLAVYSSILPGTWDSWDANIAWDADEETWDE